MMEQKIDEPTILILHPGESVRCDEGTITVLVEVGTATVAGDAVTRMVPAMPTAKGES